MYLLLSKMFGLRCKVCVLVLKPITAHCGVYMKKCERKNRRTGKACERSAVTGERFCTVHRRAILSLDRKKHPLLREKVHTEDYGRHPVTSLAAIGGNPHEEDYGADSFPQNADDPTLESIPARSDCFEEVAGTWTLTLNESNK